MRTRKEHVKADLLLLGYTISDVHEYMDYAVKWMGAGHRSVGHSYDAIRAAGMLFGKRGKTIALLHLLIDNHIVDGKLIKKYI